MSVDDATAQEQRLIKKMLSGDERAFRSFFDKYFPRVYRFALPRLGGVEEAGLEVAQTTLGKAMTNLHRYRGEAALTSWLCQICRNEIVDYLRAYKRRTERIVLTDDSPTLQAAVEAVEAPLTDDPAQHYNRAETRSLIQSALDNLPGRYGDILEWKYVEGRSVEEIGKLLGVGYIAAQSLLARARASFRERLQIDLGATAQDVLASMLRGKW